MKISLRLISWILSSIYATNIFLARWLPEKLSLLPDTVYVRYLVWVYLNPRRLRHMHEVFRHQNLSEARYAEMVEANVKYRIRLNGAIARCDRIPLEILQQQNLLHGEEHLQAALKEGRGVMLLGGHVGSFFIYPCLLGLMGYDISVIGVPNFPASLEKQTRRLLKHSGGKRIITGSGAARAAAQVFRRNGILSTLCDMRPAPNSGRGVEIPLGGTTVILSDGPARLATRFDVSVVPVISCITSPYRSEIYLGPAFERVHGKNADETVRLTMLQWWAWLEPHILARPDQWWTWPHLSIPSLEKQNVEQR